MTARERLVVAAKGFCMGAADVVPGVSGGTMAFILGIYQRLLEAVRAFDVELLRRLSKADLRGAANHVDLQFLLLLGAGIFSALMFFTRVVPLPSLLRTHPEPVYGLFFGLVSASVLVLLAEFPRLALRDALWIGLGLVLGLAVVNLVPMDTPETAWFVFLSGSFAICAMILPGISGSFVLLILRKYTYVFSAVGRLDLSVLLPFALGAVVGLMLFSRLLVWLLHHWYRATLLTITGVLVGSLWMLWPFQHRAYEVVKGKERLTGTSPIWPEDWGATTFGALALIAAGFAAVWLLHTLSMRRRDGVTGD